MVPRTLAAGIAEPVRGGVEPGLRLGVGKAEEDSHYTAAENIVRKRLEVEVQADEDEERTRRREVRACVQSALHAAGHSATVQGSDKFACTSWLHAVGHDLKGQLHVQSHEGEDCMAYTWLSCALCGCVCWCGAEYYRVVGLPRCCVDGR